MASAYDRRRLMGLFPALDWDATTVVRCTRDTSSEGRLTRTVEGRPCHANVCVQCRPAFALSVLLDHRWPEDVAPEDRAALDEALVTGVVEGLASGEYPAWLCQVRTTGVTYVAGQTVGPAVRLAAQMAVRDALRSRSWKLMTWPRGASPRGQEPA